MRSSSKFSCVMTMISDFLFQLEFFFIIFIHTKILFYIYSKLFVFHKAFFHHLLMVSFLSFLQLISFIAKCLQNFPCSLFISKNFFRFLMHRMNSMQSVSNLKAHAWLFFLCKIFQDYFGMNLSFVVYILNYYE